MTTRSNGRRIAIASLMQETNTFSPIPTDIALFESYYLLRGDELFTGYDGAHVEVPAMIEVLEQAGYTPVPLLAGYAAAAGPVTRPAFDRMVGEIEERLAGAGPVDGVLLALHGALVVEDAPSGDTEIIERVRRCLPQGVPIGVTFDLHAHVTPGMLLPDTFIIGYKEYPHIDMYETGARAASLMVDTLEGRRHPVMALEKRPLLVPAVNGRTTDGPLSSVAAAARSSEAANEVLHASIFPVQPWIDVPDLGFAALVCADGDADTARAVAKRLADMAFDSRREFALGLTPLAEAIRIGLTSDGMTLVSDSGDAPTGGAAADSPAVLRALLAGGADRADRLSLITLCDPAASRAAHVAGSGAEMEFALGNGLTGGGDGPVSVTARILSVSDGTYKMLDPGTRGLSIRMGPTAVLGVGAIRILVRSEPSTEWDTAMFRSQGLDPATAALVFVKSPSHFRATFGPLAARILIADTPGATCADVRKLPYRKVTRPLFPLDDI